MALVEKYLITWVNTITGETGDGGVYLDRLEQANRIANGAQFKNPNIVYTVVPVMVDENERSRGR